MADDGWWQVLQLRNKRVARLEALLESMRSVLTTPQHWLYLLTLQSVISSCREAGQLKKEYQYCVAAISIARGQAAPLDRWLLGFYRQAIKAGARAGVPDGVWEIALQAHADVMFGGQAARR